MRTPTLAATLLLSVALAAATAARAQPAQSPPAPSAGSPAPAGSAAPAPAAAPLLFAVEIKTGTAWDPAKPPPEQAHFREHSANLKKLRDQGSLVLGARYSDKGLIVLQAASEADAHAMMRQDPAIEARVFAYTLHPFNVFYGGTVAPRRRE